ncbi:MAG: bifunctional (p)ppGpp synthetase/guanosine-3',5'-bis(diphosphate) 3'-pyrophosphohydrolase [Ekhidna sp.]|nr:bifunctional (p)ppGpp synthetase/guanosine-3',5'-bis(diphosphate) 3'-pyrophosphohydrolase [Ekhidna sp.]MBC6426336.1 bifunctional (p)ppGpp synthetase/guanosine-3',5'-bis(diphosphate) 3'-pyrophosphohydrolase [Ekhidna sp.]
MVEEDLEAEKKEIVNRYRCLLRKAKPILKDGDAKLIKKAFHTSMEAHSGMRRRSGEPYILHPLEVAEICVSEIGLGTTSIIAALLHDTVEDTDYEITDIKRIFGEKVARIIDGLTKISGVFEQGSSRQAENFRKMLLTLSDDVRVILIKMADRLHNMRTLQSMPRNKQLKIANETIYLYAPLAHRLGLYAFKSELEDLYLKYSEPEVFGEITSKIKDTKDARAKFIRNFIKPIKNRLSSLGIKYEIKGRPKSIYSIWSKMKKQDIPFEEVFDLFAIRIILDVSYHQEKACCWQVYSLVTDYYQPNPDRLRDWISIPKANGYESLHTTVMSGRGQWVEVQIRTKRMDEIAEKGYAAHWKYKDGNTSDETGLEMWITKVREILAQNDASAIEFVNDFKSNLYSDEVFVFTPKGDLKTLPQKATVLDFAFDIHTEVGTHCLGAKVNQKLVPLNFELKNGDQVEILTSKKQKPNESWLQYVVSSKAKSKIKDALKEERKSYIGEGKEIVKRKIRQLKLNYSQSVLDEIVNYFNVKTVSDLFYMIGTGKIEHSLIKSFHKVSNQGSTGLRDVKLIEEKLRKIRKTDNDLLLLGADLDIVDYKFAKCCNPIAGDDVFGFVTVSDGIKIHRTTCPNAAELLSNYGYRIIKAKWASSGKHSFEATLSMIGTDRLGLVSDVSNIISEELKVNMRSLLINTEGGIFEGTIKLYIEDTSHLAILVKKLEKVSGVVKVSRSN